ncbi:TrbG/VirB9 family P-type conjugative transfer protein [Sphingomonas nostoxanthinifaciens]|uniref:TrbG/VirB9 family P-type conjugative transfer protein n=1 Tax=Sphingomonas nostoxanthinifaciens TaxID=2872652 RepID=UPI001CC2066B|nr:TrbG/VirB9 family P-type conjugative transfer protein [Sphingomonas nostoxanthinifaciens]UAK23164.1 TrbG/VirB9 family P-type conjugative transfer protein [Sphingomonas nostoxanthinifaciens]
MIRPSQLLALLAISFAVPALADPRITTRLYEASNVVTLHGRTGVESTIAFAPEERIENIAVGNSSTWQVTPNKRANLLFVKPSSARARSNMTVVTDQRTYLFDLVSSPNTAPVYMLRFSYPVPLTPVAATSPPPAPPVTVVAVNQPAAPDPTPPDLHFDWHGKGDRALLPARSFDDGRATYLSWAKDATLPAILARGPNGAEGPVNYTVAGDYIVVDGVPAELILRTGRQMATITAPARQAPASTQTASAQR